MDGIGAMLHFLKGGSDHSSDEYAGKIIKDASISDDKFNITFDDGKKIQIWDNGQSCCEHRYITCDDYPKDLIGGKFVHVKVEKTKTKDEEYGESHEIAFIVIQTDKAAVTFCTHNEHNGYYGGFGLTITES